ncbi:MAG: hypothetical protein DMD82_07395 [Candidatus Rokuibacteriota bacterium]|nr:MAG: hypothetical protein DMD82_07395 [Candidatus Rokubacteria bacterium]
MQADLVLDAAGEAGVRDGQGESGARRRHWFGAGRVGGPHVPVHERPALVVQHESHAAPRCAYLEGERSAEWYAPAAHAEHLAWAVDPRDPVDHAEHAAAVGGFGEALEAGVQGDGETVAARRGQAAVDEVIDHCAQCTASL